LQLRLEFKDEVYVQEAIKTQFAGVQAHIEVLKLLEAVKPFFRQLKIEDERETVSPDKFECIGRRVKYSWFGRIQGTTGTEKRARVGPSP
jgi:hypothetical protein